MKRLIAGLHALTGGFAILCFGFMVVAGAVPVIGRYLLPIKLGNAVESAAFAPMWLACSGAGRALRHGAVDALPAMLLLRTARVVSVLIAVGCLMFLAGLIHGGVLLPQQGVFQTPPRL